MTKFERAYLCLEPFLPPLYRLVRKRLIQFAKAGQAANFRILDVGGRKSHYTTNLKAQVTVSDLPRESDVQKQLNLGTNDEIIRRVRGRRGNIEAMIYDDMTHSSLPDNSFDCIVAVEVLEHVEEDGRFLDEVARVLKPGGVFLMTTPNGDFVANHNPDHKRHYKRDELAKLLADRFASSQVDYAIVGGKSRKLGLRPWSAKKPLQTLTTMAANVVNGWKSGKSRVANQTSGTHHLIAQAFKK